MTQREYDVSDAELEVLSVLWGTGPATVREVMLHLGNNGRRLAYTTVQTVLNRLEQKGFVASDRSELAFVFRARVTKDRVRRSRLKSLVGKLYDGAAGPLVLHLVKTQKLSEGEIAQLHELIDRLDASSSGDH